MEEKEMKSLLTKSLQAHMGWILPKIKNKVHQLEAKVASETIVQFISLGKIDPKEISHPDFWNDYGGKVKQTYSEIYNNMQKRFVDGWGNEYVVERIL
jgi:hypothetical protein